MAKLADKTMFNGEDIPYGEDIYEHMERMKAQEKEFEAYAKSLRDNAPEGSIVGEILRYTVADSYAIYLITSEKPLTLTHIGLYDGYRVHPAQIKGMTLKSVRAEVELSRKFRKISNQ